ncbi:ABC transporter substrate-binding protein [Aestuariirhabdus sp. Z084]|uniref:TRAP transporter substrate-binding protein n=1 Tax=Aestuariirhabdus haliotis TaxID=2918751 RepID=UPI00201B3FF8|nr:ABC transporter substrate-binding protein [Aestuariirhabdus haliotis]MCL6414062.1 ABC transporter substrate-binding protein [Aestuariirhabdus haliotis]MCL6417995.1 ABC transporter substrate-binding protein [Aestuariirhabdus haliotis]
MKNLIRFFVAALCLVSNSLLAVDNHTLRLAQSWDSDMPIFADTTRNFAKMVSLMSDGRLQINIVPASNHQKPYGIFDMVKSGQYDMGHSASYYWKDQVPNTLFFTTMPFGMIASEQYAWFYHGGGMELMDKVYSPHNLMSFPGGNTGNQMGGWFRKKITSVKDLEGLKMRVPGFAGEIFKQLGADVVDNISSAELYDAFASKKLDAVEWVGPAMDRDMGLHKVAPYYYTGWHEPAAELQFLINKQVMKKLPKDLQEILIIAMRTAAYDMYVQSTYENGKSWRLITDAFPKIQVLSFPPAVMSKLRGTNTILLNGMAKKDRLAAKIIKSQNRYLKSVRKWTNLAERAHIRNTQQ